MFFSRITINPGTENADDLVALIKGNVYAFHRVMWRLFPDDPDAKRDFLFRMETGNGRPFFYMVSERRPRATDSLFTIETKTYDPVIDQGQCLSFSLRANPVVTRKTADGKRVRHDIIMDSKTLAGSGSDNLEPLAPGLLEHTQGIAWLHNRASGLGFDIDPGLVRVFGYRQHRLKSRKQKDLIRFSSLDFTGRLAITDKNRFRDTLFNGIGRAKAFGCGLMLVRRI